METFPKCKVIHFVYLKSFCQFNRGTESALVNSVLVQYLVSYVVKGRWISNASRDHHSARPPQNNIDEFN